MSQVVPSPAPPGLSNSGMTPSPLTNQAVGSTFPQQASYAMNTDQILLVGAGVLAAGSLIGFGAYKATKPAVGRAGAAIARQGSSAKEALSALEDFKKHQADDSLDQEIDVFKKLGPLEQEKAFHDEIQEAKSPEEVLKKLQYYLVVSQGNMLEKIQPVFDEIRDRLPNNTDLPEEYSEDPWHYKNICYADTSPFIRKAIDQAIQNCLGYQNIDAVKKYSEKEKNVVKKHYHFFIKNEANPAFSAGIREGLKTYGIHVAS